VMLLLVDSPAYQNPLSRVTGGTAGSPISGGMAAFNDD
jgi:hypothetical protein